MTARNFLDRLVCDAASRVHKSEIELLYDLCTRFETTCTLDDALDDTCTTNAFLSFATAHVSSWYLIDLLENHHM